MQCRINTANFSASVPTKWTFDLLLITVTGSNSTLGLRKELSLSVHIEHSF